MSYPPVLARNRIIRLDEPPTGEPKGDAPISMPRPVEFINGEVVQNHDNELSRDASNTRYQRRIFTAQRRDVTTL